MRPVVRNIASIVVSLTLVGCDDFLGIGGDVDVEVVAEVRQADNIISSTVENRGSDTVYFTAGYLERREGDEWRWILAGVRHIQPLYIDSIEPGEIYSTDRPIETDPDSRLPGDNLLPGEYRYTFSLYEDGSLERPLSEEARTSNTVRIE